jgi:hypothetical protein
MEHSVDDRYTGMGSDSDSDSDDNTVLKRSAIVKAALPSGFVLHSVSALSGYAQLTDDLTPEGLANVQSVGLGNSCTACFFIFVLPDAWT